MRLATGRDARFGNTTAFPCLVRLPFTLVVEGRLSLLFFKYPTSQYGSDAISRASLNEVFASLGFFILQRKNLMTVVSVRRAIAGR